MESNQNKPIKNDSDKLILILESVIYLVVLILVAIVFLGYQFFNDSGRLLPWPKSEKIQFDSSAVALTKMYTKESKDFWQAPSLDEIKGSALESQILYGKDLIVNTAKYLGPNGSVVQISNGLNCQNCHLDAGTKLYGNNYGSVASTFPKLRARSGTVESIYKRVNDCFERSLNGQPLDTLSAEMQAIKAYMLFLGTNVAKGVKVNGSGFKTIPYLDRAADPAKGKLIYDSKCATCHMPDGQGVKNPDGIVYSYPPLWGKHSYNDGAGLYRISNFAKYVRYNMPLGATYEAPQLTDEEAWDVAAYVNSQPRPHKESKGDYPDLTKKPIDHPFSPYSDNFSEQQHKYGPFGPIAEAAKSK